MRSADLISMEKYATTAAIKSLIVREGEEEIERMRRKKRITIIALRCGSGLILGGTIVRILSYRVGNASISDICR